MHLVVEQLTAQYPSGEGVHRATFTLEPGQVGVLLGPNGAGKTTLLKALSTLLPFSGSVRLGSLTPAQGSAWRKALAVLPDDPDLPDWLSGAELANFVRDLWAEDQGYLGRFYALVELFFGQGSSVLKNAIRSYSRGMEQRLGLALVLARSADLYLLDEPDAHLDVLSVHRLQAELRKLAQRGKPVLVSTHDPWLASRLAQRTFLMQKGRLREVENPESIEVLLRILEEDGNSISDEKTLPSAEG